MVVADGFHLHRLLQSGKHDPKIFDVPLSRLCRFTFVPIPEAVWHTPVAVLLRHDFGCLFPECTVLYVGRSITSKIILCDFRMVSRIGPLPDEVAG